MPDHLHSLALQLRDDPFFLASTLALFAESEGMDDTKLASKFGCEEATLVLLKLCRTPDSSRFLEDVERIASRFQINSDALAEAVRGGQAIFHLRQMNSHGQGTLMAARDSRNQSPTDQERGDS